MRKRNAFFGAALALGAVAAAHASSFSSDQAMYAVVAADGTLVRGSNAISAGKLGTGTYEVIFRHNVTGCVYITTLGNPDLGTPARGFAPTASRSAAPPGVFIQTYNTAGTSFDSPFHISVAC